MNHVLLFHGMGTHAKGWSQGLVDAFTAAAKQFDPYKGQRDLAQDVRFVEVVYDDTLQKVLDRWGKASGALTAAAGGEVLPNELLDVLTALEKQEKAGGDLASFLWTHVMDPALWCTHQQVRQRLIAALAPRLGEHLAAAIQAGAGVHLVAHSLGTSVVHDTLLCLTDPKLTQGVFDPAVAGYRWRSLTTFANVSTLLCAWTSPSAAHPGSAFWPPSSRVNSTANGLVDTFHDVRHALDPFTWPLRFQPTWSHGGYRAYEVQRYARLAELHDAENMIADPDVARPILRTLTGDSWLGTDPEMAAARLAHAAAKPKTAATFDELRARAAGASSWGVKEILEFLKDAWTALRSAGGKP